MKVSDFSRFILQEVIGCPDPTLYLAIIQTAYRFCDESGAWNEVQDPVDLEPGTSDYDIPAQSGAIALRVLSASIDGRDLASRPYTSAIGSGAPSSYTSSIERGFVRLYPTPTGPGQLVLRVAYAPGMTATQLPDFLMSRHADVIASGAKARLMLMPGVSWSNPGLAEYYEGKFLRGIVDARVEDLYGRNNGSLFVAPRSFK